MTLTKEELEIVYNYLKENDSETGWIEVKEHELELDKMGQTIAAIANSCLMDDKEYGYIIFGIKDATWEVVGTQKRLSSYKKGNQEGKMYITSLLSPTIDFEFFDDEKINNKTVSVIKINCASHTPVSFKKEIYIRIGSNNKNIRDYPEKAKKLWQKASGFNYEASIVKKNLTPKDIYDLLDISVYFRMKHCKKDLDFIEILNEMENDGFIVQADNKYHITGLGALLLAKDLKKLNLGRKGVRVIIYNGLTKTSIKEQIQGRKGYAVGFEGMIRYLKDFLPREQRSVDGRMTTFEYYHSSIVRELIANAIIHQDLSITGSEIKIEVYDNRLEVTNPGKAVIDILRFYDCNKSRNQKLAYYMRQLKLCEELGSGIDRIVEISEKNNLFTPKFIMTDEYVNVKLFKEKGFQQMEDDDKINILFYHCCYRYSIEDYMSNSSLRARFLLDDTKSSVDKITNLIRKAKKIGIIKTGPNKTYIPFWAK